MSYIDIRFNTNAASMSKLSILVFFLAAMLSGGCMNLIPMPQSNRPPADYVGEAIEKQDWPQAYLLIERDLVSNNLLDRYKAKTLVEKFPSIRLGAVETFNTEALEGFYRINPMVAASIQWERLSIFKRSIGTDELYSKALNNYQTVFGIQEANRQQIKNQRSFQRELINDASDNETANELFDAISMGRMVRNGKTKDLLDLLPVGKVTRKDVFALIGNPSGRFESNLILTWPLRIDKDNYKILPIFERDEKGVTHSLVLSFNQNRVLTERALVRVTK